MARGGAAAAYLLKRFREIKLKMEEQQKVSCVLNKLEHMHMTPLPSQSIESGVAHVILNPSDYKEIKYEDDVNAMVYTRVCNLLKELENETNHEAFVKKASQVVVLCSATGVAGIIPGILGHHLDKEGILKTTTSIGRKLVGDFEVKSKISERMITDEVQKIREICARVEAALADGGSGGSGVKGKGGNVDVSDSDSDE